VLQLAEHMPSEVAAWVQGCWVSLLGRIFRNLTFFQVCWLATLIFGILPFSWPCIEFVGPKNSFGLFTLKKFLL